MTDWHPEERLLGLFMRGELEADESRDIVIHLLSGCESSRRIARPEFPCATSGEVRAAQMPKNWQAGTTQSYHQVVQNVLPAVWEAQSDLESEKALAPALIAELVKQPHERRLMLVRNSLKFRNWGLCELLIERAHQEGLKDPSASIDFARLSVEVADLLDSHHASLHSDLKCRTHSILGNSLRIAGSLQEASEEFKLAEGFLESGTGDPLERARYLELKSYLANALRRFSEAMALLDEAIGAYRSQRADHRLGRALIIKGHHLGDKGDILGAVSCLRQGLRYIDDSAEPRLLLVAKHNLTRNLYQAGRYHQALAMLPETRALHQSLGSEMDQIRFDWLEGMILNESNDLEGAEIILREVKQRFVDKGVTHDTALVSLDLATIYLKQKRIEELKSIASEMLTVFQALRINREVIAALVLFQKAVELDRATLGLVRDLAAYLKNSQHEARLPFRPSRTN